MLRFGAFLFWSRDDEYQQCFFHKKFMEWPSQLLDSLFFFVKKILRCTYLLSLIFETTIIHTHLQAFNVDLCDTSSLFHSSHNQPTININLGKVNKKI